jgi:hypothetical protein
MHIWSDTMSGTESDYFEKGGGGCLMASLSRSLKYQTGTYFSTSLKSTCTWHEVHKRLFIFTYIYVIKIFEIANK